MSVVEALVEQICMSCPHNLDYPGGVCDQCSIGEMFEELSPEEQKRNVAQIMRQKGEK